MGDHALRKNKSCQDEGKEERTKYLLVNKEGKISF